LVYQVTQGKAAFQAFQGSLDSQDSLAFQVIQGLVSQATQALAFLVTRDSQALVYQGFQDSLGFLAAQDFPAFRDSLVSQAFLAPALRLPYLMKVSRSQPTSSHLTL
jgi:hypothetical protein